MGDGWWTEPCQMNCSDFDENEKFQPKTKPHQACLQLFFKNVAAADCGSVSGAMAMLIVVSFHGACVVLQLQSAKLLVCTERTNDAQPPAFFCVHLHSPFNEEWKVVRVSFAQQFFHSKRTKPMSGFLQQVEISPLFLLRHLRASFASTVHHCISTTNNGQCIWVSSTNSFVSDKDVPGFFRRELPLTFAGRTRAAN